MKDWSHIYWLTWFFVFFGVGEAIGYYRKDFDTLSNTWTWINDSIPIWASIVLSASLSSALVWLATVHWIWKIWDKPGFDFVEKIIIAIGFISGAAGAYAVRKKKEDI